MTALVALGPLAATPLLVWLLMEFGPERSVIFALYWIIPSVIFAIAMPIMRWRGWSLAQASARAVAWALVIPSTPVIPSEARNPCSLYRGAKDSSLRSE